MSTLIKTAQIGAPLLVFLFTLVFPAPFVLTAIQMALIVMIAVLTYNHFGDEIRGIISYFEGDKNGKPETADARESGSQERTAESAADNDAGRSPTQG